VTLDIHPAAWLSLGGAVSFGLAAVLLKRGLQYMSPLTAAVISVTVTTVFVWIVVAATGSLALVSTWAVLPFLAAGLVAPGPARRALFTAVQRTGVSRASAIVSVTPMFAVGAAVLFLGEQPPASLVGGAALVVVGAALLSYRAARDTGWRRRDMAFPIMAALGFAFRDTVSRWGFQQFPHPLAAAAVATAMSLAVMWVFAALRGWARSDATRHLPGAAALDATRPRTGSAWSSLRTPGAVFLVASGLCEGTAYLTMWRALAIGDVSMVSPLVNSHALFAVLLAAVFLRDIEQVTWRIVVACALIVAGVLLVIGARSA